MSRLFARWMVGLLLAAALVGFSRVAARPDKDSEKKKPTTADTSGTVITVVDSLDDALKMLPKAVLISPEKYKELLDELEKLRKKTQRPKRLTPSKCLLKGKIDGNLLTLQAQFEFATDKPGTVVHLACTQGQATGVTLDGKTPRLLGGKGKKAKGDEEPEGFAVQVDKTGEHTLSLDLVLALSTRPAGQGFTLDLPRAAITRLELELPAAARDVRLGTKAIADTLLRLKGTQLKGGIGVADKLDLSWKSPQAAAAGAVLAAEGVIKAKLDSKELSTEAKLTLRVLGGQTKQWRLLVPLKAKIEVAEADKNRVARFETQDQKQASLRTIHLKEAEAESLSLTITSTVPPPKSGSGKAVFLGPFSVLGASKQSGSLILSNTQPNWHLEFSPHGDLTRRDATDEELRLEPTLVAAFRYGPGGGSTAGNIAWLEVEAATLRSQTNTRSTQTLTLIGDPASKGDYRWQLAGSITVTPRRADIDRLVVQFPAGWEYSDEAGTALPDRVRQVAYDRATRSLEFRLTRGKASPSLDAFTVAVDGLSNAAIDVKTPQQIRLALPKLKDSLEQDGEIVVRVPRSLEIVPPRESSPRLVLKKRSPHELTWRCPRQMPGEIAFSIKPYRPAIEVDHRVDLILGPGTGTIRQELRYSLPKGITTVDVRVPRAVAGTIKLVSGGRFSGQGDVRQITLALASPSTRGSVTDTSSGTTVVLTSTFPLSPRDVDRPLAVPLVTPLQAVGGKTRVRVWSDAGPLPLSADGWNEENIERVAGNPRLPVLVLGCSRGDRSLALRVSRNATSSSAIIERVLIRAEVGGDGIQTYRARYRLLHLTGRHLDFELPAPIPSLGLKVSLDGTRLEPELLPPDRPESKGRLMRLRLSPSLVSKPAVLEISYRLSPERSGSTSLGVCLTPPRLRGNAEVPPTRWQVYLPSQRVLLWPESSPGLNRFWGRRGWLLAPRLSITARDLDRWFQGVDRPGDDAVDVSPDFVCWREDSDPIRLTLVPDQAWLLVCSLTLLVVGLALTRLASSVWLWPVLIILVLVGVLSALFWPWTTAQVIRGCQPGAAVLLIITAIQWALHERRRRQIIFLPSFTPARPGSSVGRADQARPLEPTTVDASPRPIGSSVERRGG